MASFHLGPVLAVFSFPALGGLLFGYDIGATSFAVKQIIDGDYDGVKWNKTLDDSDSLQGAITSASVFGALIASLLVFKLSDVIGRKTELLIGSVFYGVGALVEALSAQPDWDASTGISVLILGKVIYGLGIGFSMHGAPAYIGEMSPPSVRGLLVSLKEAVIVVGILLGFLIGVLVSSTKAGWAYLFGAAIVPAMIMFVGSLSLHESARWLFLNGRPDEASKALSWVLPLDMVETALADMAAQEQTVPVVSNRKAGSRDGPLLGGGEEETPSVWNKKYRYALLAGVGLVFLQQVTGQPSVLYYAASIFSDAGLANEATIGMAAFKLLMTMGAVFTVDRLGRRLLLFIGISVMLAALVALCIGFNFMPSSDDDDDSDQSISGTQVVILIALFAYIGGYQIGFGPISWLLISEVFPLEVRGQAVSLAVQTNFFWNVVTNYLFPIIVASIGPSMTFGLFAVIDLYAIYHVFAFVPETKGLSLEQIELLFDPKRTVSVADRESTRAPLLRDTDDV